VNTEFEKLLQTLHAARVKFVLIGGLAAIAHGAATLTGDVDICYARDRQNLERLVQALAPFHPRLRGVPPDLPFRLDLPTLRAGLNFTLTTDLADLDLMGEVLGLGAYDAVSAVAEEIEVYGFPCSVLTLEGLIRAKRAAGRPKDLRALHELEALETLKQKG
jgi:predicted nucleotidyltransferase